jgi:hypothetical protein
MYAKIKQLADEALRLQNKDRMDSALHEISLICLERMQDKSVALDETVVGTPDDTTAPAKPKKGGAK